jgi:pimeloyl-ACP methyl ester carboxylesterase
VAVESEPQATAIRQKLTPSERERMAAKADTGVTASQPRRNERAHEQPSLAASSPGSYPSAMANPPLTFVPGAAGLGAFWDPVRERLPSTLSHTTLNWPGFGGAPSLGVESYDALVEHVAARLPPRGVVIGQSMGGFVALQLALRHPERVSQLVLTVAAAGVDMARHGALDWRSDSRSAERDKPAWIYEPVADLSGKLDRIRVPVLLLWATRDRLSPIGVAEQLRDSLPDARLVSFDSDDHWFVHHFAEQVTDEIVQTIIRAPSSRLRPA